jgi:S1-C subfamily serine protease
VASIYNLSEDHGVLIASVIRDGPTDKAGLETRDIITAIDNQDIPDTGELTRVISSSEIGQTVKITHYRGNNEQTADVTLAESPSSSY